MHCWFQNCCTLLRQFVALHHWTSVGRPASKHTVTNIVQLKDMNGYIFTLDSVVAGRTPGTTTAGLEFLILLNLRRPEESVHLD